MKPKPNVKRKVYMCPIHFAICIELQTLSGVKTEKHFYFTTLEDIIKRTPNKKKTK